jgi:PAS domain S-box-containing protein
MASSVFAARSGSGGQGPGLQDLLRSFTSQARLALGTRGVLLASFAGVVGLVCCLVAFADIGLSLHRSDVDPQRRRAREVLQLDNSSRFLMRSLLASSAADRPIGTDSPMAGEPWRDFTRSLASLCRDFAVPARTMLASTCATRDAFLARVGAEVQAADERHVPLTPRTLSELLSLRDDIAELTLTTTGAADGLIGHMVDDYATALLVLTLSTTGFACAGVMLILLVGRASMDYHAQWQRAAAAADEAGASRDLLREVIEALPAGVAVYDSEERLVMSNAVADSLTPMMQEGDATGLTYEALARDTARRMEAAGRGPQNPDEWIARFRRKSAVPSRRPAEGGRWFDWSEKVTGSGLTVGLRIDVTDIARHETELERARADYQSLIDSLADVAYRLDVETGRFVFVSAAAADFFGLAPEQMVGTHFLEYIAPDSAERVRGVTTRAYDPDDPGTFARFTMLAAGGAPRRVEVRARRRLDAEGRVISVGLIRDVEERVQLEARLESEMTRLRSVVESAGALIVMVDKELDVTMVNSGFTALTGIAEADAVGRPLHSLIDVPLDPARTSRTRLAIKLTDRHGGGDAGRERLIAITATPVTDAQGEVGSIVLLGVDDTERRLAEQALYDAERFATVGEMAGTMAHEISQPLQVINISCALAREELADAVARGAPGEAAPFVDGKLDRIASQVEAASRIIGDLRAYVRGTSMEATGPFDPNDAVRRAIDMTDHGVREAGMHFAESLAGELPAVVGDVGRLEQVLVNLVNNARDAGGRTIALTTGTTEDDGRSWVRIAVEDSGPGIPAEILPQLFHSFVTTKPRGKGTGLGLRICRRILEEMGGRISAANRAEGGARFEILLPAVKR